LILGKISVGVLKMTTGLRIRMSSAKTINVYGRFRAILTIHILFPRLHPGVQRAAETGAILYETYSIVVTSKIRCLSEGESFRQCKSGVLSLGHRS
jgi:hypothetical protein